MKFFEKIMIDDYLDEMTYSQIMKARNKLLGSGEIFPNKKGKFECKKCGQTFPSPKLAAAHYVGVHGLKESINEAPIGTKGWTKKSIEKFGKTVGVSPTEHGFFDACVSRMEGKKGFDKKKAQGFCASIKDAAYDSTYWRGKDKPKSQIKKDTKKKVPKSERLPKK